MRLVKSFLYAVFQSFHKHACRNCSLRNLFIVNCVVLFMNVLLFALNNHLLLWDSVESYFLPPLDHLSMKLLDRTFEAFVEAMDANNVTFFLFSGSLIGSVRHHGRIPWDDDVDVLVNITDRLRVAQALAAKDPHLYGLYMTSDASRDYEYQWKFYPRTGRKLIFKGFRSPNVDIFFYAENATHIWNTSPFFTAYEVWPKSHVFPLRRRPFGDLVVPVPCDADAFLDRNFNISMCRSREFSHVFDLWLPFKPLEVPCTSLHHLLPFVHRTSVDASGKSTQETLRIGKWTLGRFMNRNSC